MASMDGFIGFAYFNVVVVVLVDHGTVGVSFMPPCPAPDKRPFHPGVGWILYLRGIQEYIALFLRPGTPALGISTGRAWNSPPSSNLSSIAAREVQALASAAGDVPVLLGHVAHMIHAQLELLPELLSFTVAGFGRNMHGIAD